MLSPSDFNNAVPQFTNGDYASNPINPQYIAEPSAEDYNRGSEPLQTLPAQWWNWFLNKFTNRFNKVNIYVKNIFNELAQLLSLVSETPSGTEGTPTVGQLKDMFETKYPDYLKTTAALSNTFVPQTTKVNGHELSGNISITCVSCAGANGSGTAFGTAATVNTGTAAGCIPTVGTALGTTNGQFLATDANGKLKPSGYSASSFRASSWTPALVECANKGKNGSSYSAFGSNAFNSTAFTTCTGTVTSVCIKCGTSGAAGFITTSGTITLAANAFNQYATISTTTYPGACCTGTLTSSSGCAYDSARLGGTAASSYLKTTGCAADSAKLGGCSLASVRCGYWTIGAFGNVTYGKNSITKQWFISNSTTAAGYECDLYKAFCKIFSDNPQCVQGAIYGKMCVKNGTTYIDQVPWYLKYSSGEIRIVDTYRCDRAFLAGNRCSYNPQPGFVIGGMWSL